MSKTNVWVLAISGAMLIACGSEPEAKTADDSAATSTAAADASSTPATSSSDTPKTETSATPTASPKAGNETTKDPSALVLDLKYLMKGGGKVDPATAAELQKAALERMKTSSKLASPESKVDKPRKALVTVMVDEPTSNAKGLTIKMGLVGVEPDGRCPLFDLEQNFTMSGAKSTNADDVLTLRKSAIVALLEKLEQTAPSLKPQANCSTFKGPNK